MGPKGSRYPVGVSSLRWYVRRARPWTLLDVRAARASNSLAELYSPDAMPPDLVEAHRNLDRVVDAAYGRHQHKGDTTRLPVLLRRYIELTDRDPTLFDEQS